MNLCMIFFDHKRSYLSYVNTYLYSVNNTLTYKYDIGERNFVFINSKNWS